MLARTVLYLVGFVTLGFLCNPGFADIYAFVDDNGVRHISNSPDDPRYKLVMRTPTYKKPAKEIKVPVAAAKEATATGNGWNLITPKNPKTVINARFFSRSNLNPSGKRGKPFKINEANRRHFTRDIARIAARHRLDPHLIHAVISAESGFNPKAISRAGAQGLMQLMPATAERFGVRNSFDPVANISGGATYLRWLLNEFRGNISLALAGYNAGENAVKKYGNKIPPYKETQTYVSRVLQFYNHYRRIN